jgi:hypothetical protein
VTTLRGELQQLQQSLQNRYAELEKSAIAEATTRFQQWQASVIQDCADQIAAAEARATKASAKATARAEAQIRQIRADLHQQYEQERRRAEKVFAKQVIAAAERWKAAIQEAGRLAIAEAEADKLSKIKARNAEHRRREQYLLAQIEDLKALIHQRDTQLKEEFSKAVEPYEALYEELDQALAQYAEQVGSARVEFSASYRAKQEENERLHQELRQYRNPVPFRGTSKADITGNRLIDFYLARGIILDAEKCDAKLDKSIIWVRPRATTMEGINDHLADLQIAFELTQKPTPTIESGCIRFDLKDAIIELPKEIVEPPPEQLLEAVAKANHVRINAPTDSGKSTLLDNVLNLYRLIHRGEMKLTLLDPKYPFTPWQGHSPDYKGFRECLSAVTQLSELIDQRLTEARTCADRGEAIPSYEPHLFAIDELEALHDDAIAADDNKRGDITKSLERALRTGLKVGRGLTLEKGKGIKVLYVTQSPLCSRIGLNRDDFEQSLNLYSGGNIALVLQDGGELDGKILDAKRRALSREYEARLAAGQTYILLVRQPNGKGCFLMQAPPPGYWHQRARADGVALDVGHQAIAPAITCRHCGSDQVVKNGNGSQGRKRYKCKACSKGFQV